MGRDIAFESPLGSISGWRSDPVGAPHGGLVVVQEIFGVNAHMRGVCDRYAAAGFVALAPAYFDPVERGVELGYDQDGFARGKALVMALGFDPAVAITNVAPRCDAASNSRRRACLPGSSRPTNGSSTSSNSGF